VWNAEAARQDDTGRKFWAFISTVPLTLLMLANLYAASRAAGAVRGWWLAAALTALAGNVGENVRRLLSAAGIAMRPVELIPDCRTHDSGYFCGS
jgi:hypothetical protein